MPTSALLSCWLRRSAALALVLVAALPLAARADPPARAARLSFVSGDASFAPSGSDEWVAARLNRPLWIGDRLWSANGNVELQIGGAALRLAPRTSLTVLNFDDRIAQFEVTQGSVALSVRAIDDREDSIEVATPTLAFVVRTEGDYRVDVDPDRTAVGVRRGWAEVWGAGNAFRIDRREQFVFYDADLRDYDVVALQGGDAFDRWARDRARREDQSVSSRYVSPELVGYVDLDTHGEWRTDQQLGAVWYPRVEANWAPYRNGHWTWIDPWGWTWVDDAPWGFAPFHYGRWTYAGNRWGWVPGPRDVRPVYAPALVAWVGGDSFSLSIGSGPVRGVGWYPLGPGEMWRPSYDVTQDYFTRVNVSNTYVNQTTVVNFYNESRSGRPMRYDYRYRTAPTALTVIPVEAFVESRPVYRNVVNVNTTVINQVINQAPVAAAPAVRPVMQSFVGSAPRSQARPPAESLQRTVVARQAPPAAVPSLEQRVNIVRERGRPIDRQALEQMKPAAAPAQAPAASAPSQPGRAPEQQVQRTTSDLRSGVRVVGGEQKGERATAALPPSTTEGVVRTPRGPVQNVPPAAAQPGDDAARAKGNETRRDAEARSDRPGPPAQSGRPDADRPGRAARPNAEAPGQPRGGEAQAPRGRTDSATEGQARPPAAASTPPAAAPAPSAPPSTAPSVKDRDDGARGRGASPDRAPNASRPPAAAERTAPAARQEPDRAPASAPPAPARAEPPVRGRDAGDDRRGSARNGAPQPRPPSDPAPRVPEAASPAPERGPASGNDARPRGNVPAPNAAREAPGAPAPTPAPAQRQEARPDKTPAGPTGRAPEAAPAPRPGPAPQAGDRPAPTPPQGRAERPQDAEAKGKGKDKARDDDEDRPGKGKGG